MKSNWPSMAAAIPGIYIRTCWLDSDNSSPITGPLTAATRTLLCLYSYEGGMSAIRETVGTPQRTAWEQSSVVAAIPFSKFCRTLFGVSA